MHRHHSLRAITLSALLWPLMSLATVQAADLSTPVGASPTMASIPAEEVWASTGDPSRPMREPSFLAIDPHGILWVTDGHHSQFQLLAADGTFLESWGTPGSEDGQFNFVRSDEMGLGAVAFAADGTIYVADTGNHRVQVFAPDRHWVASWDRAGRDDGQFVDPIALSVGPDGLVYVVDDYRDDVQVFTPDGRFVRAFGQEGTGPGQFLDAGSGIAFDHDGNILVADNGGDQIERFAPDGTWLSTGSESGQFRLPMGLALDGQGNAYVSDTFDNRVQQFHLLAPLSP